MAYDYDRPDSRNPRSPYTGRFSDQPEQQSEYPFRQSYGSRDDGGQPNAQRPYRRQVQGRSQQPYREQREQRAPQARQPQRHRVDGTDPYDGRAAYGQGARQQGTGRQASSVRSRYADPQDRPYRRSDPEREARGDARGRAQQPRDARSARTGGGARQPQQQAAASPYRDRSRYTANRVPQRGGLNLKAVAIAVCALAVVAVGIAAFLNLKPIEVTVNGQQYEVGGEKTLQAAIEASGVATTPGNLVAVDGKLLESGGGTPYTATVNGEPRDDGAFKLGNGDVVELGDGTDVTEPFESVETAVPYTVTTEGTGPLHVIEGEGADGVSATKTGSISGTTVTEETSAPQNPVCRNYYPDTGDDKVVAFTFDDGPSSEYTAEVLDILAENDAKATFFVVGTCVEEYPDLVKRAADAGHQICTHTYDHAEGSGQGVNLGYMTADEQVDEIEKGIAAIETAVGGEASRVVRTPGGNYSEDTQKILQSHITAEIGWSIDTQDWRRGGTGSIKEQMLSVWPGAVVLCHDGGGNREQTVEALREALPKLKEEGYRFITIDEMLKYPADEESA